MARAQCQLCDRVDELVDGHIFPRFAYKRYAADDKAGGSFVNLVGKCIGNRQVKVRWFCRECDNGTLAALEKYAAAFADSLSKCSGSAHPYDERLLRFITSVTWRVAKHHQSSDANSAKMLKAPCRRWRECLLQRRSDPRPYSQHLFVCFDPDGFWHRMLGGMVFVDARLVVSQLGPLWAVGLLDRKHLAAQEIAVWKKSELRPEGGSITPVTQWTVGKDGNITRRFADLLRCHQQWVIEQATN